MGMGFLSPGTKRGGKTLRYCLVHECRAEALMEMRFVQRLKEKFFNKPSVLFKCEQKYAVVEGVLFRHSYSENELLTFPHID